MPTRLALGLLPWLAGCLELAAESGSAAVQDPVAPVAPAWDPAPPREGNLRIATFNIRNFPAEPQDEEQTQAPVSHLDTTDQEALLSILGRLRFDVLATQEIRDRDAFVQLLGRLSSETARDYRAVWSTNPSGNAQFVGIVYDATKVSVDDVREHPEVDATGTLRPGLSAAVRSLAEGGADFRVMVLHLASGDTNKRRQLRAQQVTAASSAVAAAAAETHERDAIVMGDWNTAREAQELPVLDATLATAGLARAPASSTCTAYWVKKSSNPLIRPSLLDHVAVAGLEERDLDVPVAVGAHCATHACAPYESRDDASGETFWDVSDHCPVYFEIHDRDLDDEPAAF